jgi:hypothetical protein
MAVPTLTVAGKRFVVIPEEEYLEFRSRRSSLPNGRVRQRKLTVQDRGDIAEAKRRLSKRNSKLIPLAQLKRELGL